MEIKENAINEYLEKVDIKDVTQKMKEKLSIEEVFTEARLKLVQADFSAGSKNPQSTLFEEIKEVAFYPQERRLVGAIEIKQPFGYGGNIGSIGSYEYVGLYVDWNGDNFFNDVGTNVGVVNVHVFDPGLGNTAKLPILYAVYQDITPRPLLPLGAVVKVRAILSWLIPPTGPNFVPVWGNIIDRWIRIEPIQ